MNTSKQNVQINSSINNSTPFKPAIKLNQSCNNITMNNRYSNNLNEQSLNTQRYSTNSNKHINPEIENKYNEVFNSINQRLTNSKYRRKYKHIDNIKLIRAPSSEKIKAKASFNVHNNINCGFNFFRVTNNFFYRNSII